MKTLSIKLLLFFVVLTILNIIHNDNLHWTGLTLFKNNQLPHRSLGYLWAAWTSAPHREDYATSYILNSYLLYKNERILEGTPRRQWLECLIVRTGKVDFPRVMELHGLSRMVMKEHYRQALEPKVESEFLEK